MFKYEGDFKLLPRFWGWVLILAATAYVLAWGLLAWHFIPNVRREWDFGAMPDTPGESIFSTELPERIWPAPPQLRPPLVPWPGRIGDRSPCRAPEPVDGVDGVDEVDAGSGPEPAEAEK